MTNPTSDPLQNLLRLLEVEALGGDQYRGQVQNTGNNHLFGGFVFAQAMRAAIDTVDDRPPHSAHAYFLRAGDTKKPIEYQVERIRDGRTFATRRVIAHQGAEPIFNLALSFHPGEPSASHQMSTALPPEPVGGTHQEGIRAGMLENGIELPEGVTLFGEFEFRSADGVHMETTPVQAAETSTWLRANGSVPDGMEWNAPLLAYASDFSIMLPAFYPVDYGPMTPGVQTASLDHAIWFHKPLRVDDWLYAVQDSPVLANGRGMGRMLFYSRDGQLVASAVQEALFREKRN